MRQVISWRNIHQGQGNIKLQSCLDGLVCLKELCSCQFDLSKCEPNGRLHVHKGVNSGSMPEATRVKRVFLSARASLMISGKGALGR